MGRKDLIVFFGSGPFPCIMNVYFLNGVGWASCRPNESLAIPFSLWPFYHSQQQKPPPKEMWISPKGLLATFFGSIKVSFSFLCTRRLIGRNMCHMAAVCSWKYIICSFGWVNIAESLVNSRDRLFWERKCCLPFHQLYSPWICAFVKQTSYCCSISETFVAIFATPPTRTPDASSAWWTSFKNGLQNFFPTNLQLDLHTEYFLFPQI